ncbi:MAG TPA: SRPBCC family protein [Acidimicrobiia bacterium]|nr:SRPBCC family protein [Acidimicrobiia bacterium]
MHLAGAITHSVNIPAEPNEVFAKLLAKARDGNLDSSFEYWEPRQWPPTVGTHNDFKARMGLISMKGVSRFAEFDPPRRLLIESVKPTFPFFARMSWDLVPVGEGTRYTYRMEINAAYGVGWLARSTLRRYDKQMAKDVNALASLF